jgi:signal transduction histidine kinase
MAAAFGILKNHDGWITVDSGPGRGTSVDLFFPAADPPRSVKIR